MNMTITIIGGSQTATYKKVGQKFGCNVLFHNGKTRNGATKKEFKPLVQKSDCVVVLLGACSHITMEIVKALCKHHHVNIAFHRGMGATGAITCGLQSLKVVDVL
jgi:hypothetical protein